MTREIINDSCPGLAEPGQRIRPEVTDFFTEGCRLGEELTAVTRVYQVDAVAATVFYSGRILEALSKAAVAAVGLRVSDSVLSNLNSLVDLSLMARRTGHLANSVRMLSNDARHLRRYLVDTDADSAVTFIEPVVRWYFCTFRFGPLLRSITTDGKPLHLGRDHELNRLAGEIDDLENDPAGLARSLMQHRAHVLLRAPIASAILAEALIDGDSRNQPLALEVLQKGLEGSPRDIRLRQLTGLYWSRRDESQRALQWLEPLAREGHEDEETCGITGGAYKRLWLRDQSNEVLLRRARKAYERGWTRSRHGSPYLGINAAALQLLSGDRDGAVESARRVRDLLRDRRQAASQLEGCELGHWDEFTMAEATLILGGAVEAARLYGEAFSRNPHVLSAIATATGQANMILRALGDNRTLDLLIASDPE